MLLTLTVLLSCAMMTSAAEKDPLFGLITSIPEQDEFLIYDICGEDLSSDDVMNAFYGFNVVYKFMALSGDRFLIVVTKDSSNNTQYVSPSFVGESHVHVYPAERSRDYYRYAGAEAAVQDNDAVVFPDENLYLIEYTILDRGADVATFKADVAALGEAAVQFRQVVKCRSFHVTAMYPVKMYVFAALPSYAIDRAELEMSAIFKGQYQTNLVTTPIVNM